MELAKIIYRDDFPWRLPDDSCINPEVSTIVQVERKTYGFSGAVACCVVYFPGCVGGKELMVGMFNRYFEILE